MSSARYSSWYHCRVAFSTRATDSARLVCAAVLHSARAAASDSCVSGLLDAVVGVGGCAAAVERRDFSRGSAAGLRVWPLLGVVPDKRKVVSGVRVSGVAGSMMCTDSALLGRPGRVSARRNVPVGVGGL